MALSFIKSSGNIITEEFCEQVAQEEKASYVKDDSFGIKKIDDTIATTFDLLRERWEEIRNEVIGNDLDNSNLRQKWIMPFLDLLGFEPQYMPHNIKSKAGEAYHIPYLAWNDEVAPKIHMAHSSQDLDRRNPQSRTHKNKSPHDMLQVYLNTSPDQWALLINGKKVRLLRDFFHSITKGFIEFDLEGIFETANSKEFRILYRILHRSRFEGQSDQETGTRCLLETFHEKSRETGIKVGDNLRDQVLLAIETLGIGFAENLNPDEFTDQEVKEFYAEILNFIYRILFLLFAEQKGWLPVRNEIYARTYSINAIRELAIKGDYSHDNETDLWEGLKITFRLVSKGYTFPNGEQVNAFGGQLFSKHKIAQISELLLQNRYLLQAIDSLCYFEDKNIRNRINYANLAIDELGSVYESLLDYNPRLLKEDEKIRDKDRKRGEFALDDRSMERKSTGSYYTDSRLVSQLIESALVPVVDEAVQKEKDAKAKEAALLDLKVADIACGSGAFLIAALEKLGERLALIRMGEEDRPTEDQLREAKRDVLLHCIYGVDLNPMAVELAKFSLWITAAMPDMPLTFLDHKIKYGNSLIGATPELIKVGIPPEAYNPVTLDDKDICNDLKKQIRKELKEKEKGYGIQTSLVFNAAPNLVHEPPPQYERILKAEQETANEVADLEKEYKILNQYSRDQIQWRLADAWTSAFFIRKDSLTKNYPTNITLGKIQNGEKLNADLEKETNQLNQEYRFFHFHLEFPEVFAKGGFDCILGNPPWEMVEISEVDFFSNSRPDIANAETAKLREELIDQLQEEDPALYKEFINIKYSIYANRKFVQKSGRFPLSSKGRINLYRLFVEDILEIINKKGRVGIIVPSDIGMAAYNADLFSSLIKKKQLITFLDFENKNGIFQGVHRSYRFCLLVLSGTSVEEVEIIKFVFHALNVDELANTEKLIQLRIDDIKLFSPNTLAPPILKNNFDYRIAKKVYKKYGVLVNEKEGVNSWEVGINRMLSLSDNKSFFKKSHQLSDEEKVSGLWRKLYSGKTIHQFDHRFATYKQKKWVDSSNDEHADPDFDVETEYYAIAEEVDKRIGDKLPSNWLVGYRDVARATDERTAIASIVPNEGCDTHCRNIFTSLPKYTYLALLVANVNSFVFDFFTKQKVISTSFGSGILKQLPVLPLEVYSKKIKNHIMILALKLAYTAWDIKSFADDIWNQVDPDLREEIANHWKIEPKFKSIKRENDGNSTNHFPFSPYIWDGEERFKFRCELDAIYSHLYGITKTEMEYILETFSSVKRKDIEKYGAYRTKEAIMKNFEEMDWVREEMEKTMKQNQSI